MCESYGFTFVQSREGNDPVTQWHSVDLVRAGIEGKPFWHAEAHAGPYWYGKLPSEGLKRMAVFRTRKIYVSGI